MIPESLKAIVRRTRRASALTGGDLAEVKCDGEARLVTFPYQVRDLRSTARASTSTLAEVELLAGVSGEFHDLLSLTCVNTSGAAVTLDIRDNRAGGVVDTMVISANDTKQLTYPGTKVQNEAGNAWTIQNAGSGDISNTVVTVSADFIDNV